MVNSASSISDGALHAWKIRIWVELDSKKPVDLGIERLVEGCWIRERNSVSNELANKFIRVFSN